MSKKKNIQRKRQAAEQRRPFAFEPSYDVVVVGAGAAGLACVAACLLTAQASGCRMPQILVVEQGKRVGASVLRSGNGRCNFSNSRLDTARYRNGDFVSCVLGSLPDGPIASVLDWFEARGLVWEEAPGSGGLLYPFSNKASSVLEVLTPFLESGSVEVHTCVKARQVAPTEGGFEVLLEEIPDAKTNAAAKTTEALCPQTASVKAAQVVLAPGGGFSPSLFQSCAPGVSLHPWKATLGPLATSFPVGVHADSLDGIRMKARLSLPGKPFSEEGEVLFRPYGVSGIVVFNASRYADRGDVLCLDMMPGKELDRVAALLRARAARLGGAPARQVFRGFVLSELAEALLAAAGVHASAPLSNEDCDRLAQALKAFPLEVQGIADERQCQVHRGGVAVSGVSPQTLEVKGQPGLYVLGEALDVDGPCGGYNLHWAWACGILAGTEIARKLGKDQA